MADQILYINNDNQITLSGVKSGGSLTASATVSCTLYAASNEGDTTDTEVSGQSWPLMLSAVSGSTGTYRGVIGDDVSLTENSRYLAVITANDGADAEGEWRVWVIAKYRTS